MTVVRKMLEKDEIIKEIIQMLGNLAPDQNKKLLEIAYDLLKSNK